ncbi:enolase-phosphatase E1-like protein [Dinothrombium tinctorium]|uniref:Enolase-phosphatase E1-like protein n=1 Tax=Dinothrombium tinctorium TaxID=1965070 RepID=A0A443QMN2_9ACAR|nr:enolase-phosphatase E1-like protein [Dinothrombium tinctorium]
MVKIKRPKAIILDIEGTTTSAKFVAEKLFPYIRSHLKQYLRSAWHTEELAVTITRLREQQQRDTAAGFRPPEILESGSAEQMIQSVVNNVLWQMDNKKKNTALKQVQILVWVYGYEQEHLKGHVFEDVPHALYRWKNEFDIKLYIYSTGMVVAQQLLFSCSTHGNLLPLFDNYFDATIGAKTDPESFRTIISKLNLYGYQILFITDTYAEARAAVQAGCRALLIIRPGNKPLSEDEKLEFAVIHSFDEIDFV